MFLGACSCSHCVMKITVCVCLNRQRSFTLSLATQTLGCFNTSLESQSRRSPARWPAGLLGPNVLLIRFACWSGSVLLRLGGPFGLVTQFCYLPLSRSLLRFACGVEAKWSESRSKIQVVWFQVFLMGPSCRSDPTRTHVFPSIS